MEVILRHPLLNIDFRQLVRWGGANAQQEECDWAAFCDEDPPLSYAIALELVELNRRLVGHNNGSEFVSSLLVVLTVASITVWHVLAISIRMSTLEAHLQHRVGFATKELSPWISSTGKRLSSLPQRAPPATNLSKLHTMVLPRSPTVARSGWVPSVFIRNEREKCRPSASKCNWVNVQKGLLFHRENSPPHSTAHRRSRAFVQTCGRLSNGAECSKGMRD